MPTTSPDPQPFPYESNGHERPRGRPVALLTFLLVPLLAADARADKTWTGLGDGVSWSAAANWSGGTAPGPTDDVLLDNSAVATSYTVTLPGAVTTVDIHRLRITPLSGRTIQVVLPAGNTANPGFKIGDNLAGTDDIVLDAGAVLRNASSATTGNGIEVNGVGNGTARINNGGRYVHATQRASSGIAPRLSTVAGTELGDFEYDVPGTAPFNIAASGRTYGTLTLTRTSGPATYGAIGSSTFTIRGNLHTNPGVTFGSTMTALLSIGRDIVINGPAISLPPSQPVLFSGGVVQQVTGGQSLIVNGTSTIPLGTTVSIGSLTFICNNTASISGELRLGTNSYVGGAGPYVYDGATGTLTINSTTTFTEPDVHHWPAVSPPAIVQVLGTGGIVLTEARTIPATLRTVSMVNGAENLTFSGQAVLEGPGARFVGAPMYGAASTLRYAIGAAYARGDEWSALSGPGAPKHVEIAAGTTLDLGAGGPAVPRTVGGNLTIESGGTLTQNNIPNKMTAPLRVLGNLTVAGTLELSGLPNADLYVSGNCTVTGTLTTHERLLVFDGAGTQTISGTSLTFDEVDVQKTAGSVLLAGDLTCQSLYRNGVVDVVDLGGRTLTVIGLLGGTNPNAELRGSSTSRLVLGSDAALRFSSGAERLQALTLGSGVAVLSTDLVVEGTLALSSGHLTTGTHFVDVGAVTRTSGFVEGNLRKTVAPGTPAIPFEVGAGGTYAPVVLTFSAVTGAGKVTVGTEGGDHPSIGTSGINPARSANRLWRVTNGGVTFGSYAAVLNFVAGDVDGGANPLTFVARRYSGGAWSPATVGTRTATSTQVTGMTGFGDFAVGEVQLYTLSVATAGNGSVTKVPNQPSYPAGSVVQLTAVPASGWAFSAWSGSASGSTNPLSVTMDSNKSITATFVPTYTLTVTAIGNGTIARVPDLPAYTQGSVVQLTATPAVGWHFVSWSGDATGSTNPLAVTMNANKSITGTFAINTYTLTVSSGGNGAVTRNPSQPAYDHGTVVTVTAVPNPGYHLDSWSGDASGSANPLAVTMDSNKSITASFVADLYTLTVTTVGNGSVARDPDQPTYTYGTTVTLTPQAAPDHHFVAWSGDTSGTDDPLVIVMRSNRSITATFAPNATRTWVGAGGGGDGSSWSNPNNWNGGTAPIPSDRVVLDHSSVPGAYTVLLPGGGTGVTIERLTIGPGAGAAIELALPATNTANPGLRVGDGLAGNDDIVIGSGGVLRNASGASAGNGIEAYGTPGAVVRIDNGGRYVHQTLRSNAGVAPNLSTVTGTESGEFEYDVPGTATYAIAAASRTYGRLTLTRSGGPATYSAAGSLPLTVRGTLRLRAGVTLSSTMTAVLQLGGDLVNDGATLALPGGQPLAFNASGVQTVSGTGAVTLNGGGSVVPASTLAIAMPGFANAGTLTVDGILRIESNGVAGGAGTYTYGAGSTLAFATGGSSVTVAGAAYWPASAGPPNVTVTGAGGITMNVARTVPGTFSTASPIGNAGSLTLSGIIRRETGGSFGAGPLYSGTPTLIYNGTAIAGPEWGAGSAVGAGVPANITVESGTVHVLTADRTVPGALLVQGTLQLDPGAGELTLLGNGIFTGAFVTNGRTVVADGAATQTLSKTGGLTLSIFVIRKTAGSVVLGSDLTCATVYRNGTVDVLDLAGRTLTVSGVLGGTNQFGELRGSSTSRLVLGGDSGLRFATGTERLLDLSVAGWAALSTDLVVEGTLTLSAGRVTTGAHVIEVAAVTRTGGVVEGNLRKTVGTGSPTVMFEVGTGTNYAPVALAFSGVTGAGKVTVTTEAGDHGVIASSGLDPAKTANRFWRVLNSGVIFGSYSAVLNFVAGDVDAGANPLAFAVRRYSGGSWAPATAGTRTSTSTQALGVTGFGDFAVGEVPSYTLTVTTVGSGSVTKSPDQASYPAGSLVQLTAVPVGGWNFTGWSGDASGTTNPLDVTMDSNKAITATFVVTGPKLWTGGGDGTSWSNAANWAGGAVPLSGDIVVLDNSTVAANFTVNLPGGATTVSLTRLSILPAAARTITLVLPAANLGNPGLRAGDNTALTDDIVLGAGAVLRNSSGAVAGNGIEVNGLVNGTVRISNGGRYLHNTLRGVNGVAPQLSTAAGTETGEFEYDLPGTNTQAIASSGRTYGSLTLSSTSGPRTYTATGASAFVVRGHFRVNSGVTYSSTMAGAMQLSGNLTNGGAGLTLPANQPVNFVGAGLQTIAGPSAITIAGAATVAPSCTLAVGALTFSINGTLTIDGGLQIEQGSLPAGTGTYAYTGTGSLIFNITSGSFSVNNDKYWPTSAAPPNVNVLGAAGIGMNVNRTVTGTFQFSAPVLRSNRLTFTGTVIRNSGGSLGNAPTYSGTPTLVFAAPATVGLEWSSGSAVGPGVPRNVTIQAGAGTVTLSSGDRSVPGDLTIASGTLSLTSGSDLALLGNLSATGTIATNGRTVSCVGTGTQVLTATGGPLSLEFLMLNKSATTVLLGSDLTLTGGTGALTFDGSNEVLDLNGRTLSITGTVGGADATYSLKGGATSNLLAAGVGAMGTLRFTTGFQTLGSLTVNRTSSGTVTLATPLTVSSLVLTNGTVGTGANTLAVASGGSVTRTSGWVTGNLRKTIGTGPTAAVFEVGTSSGYAPVDVAFGNVTTAGTLTASSTAGDHPNLGSSGLDGSRNVNRYWTLTNGGIAFNDYDAVFHFNSADVDAGANFANFIVRRFVTPTWFPTVTGVRAATSTEATGLTAFGDFAIGDVQQWTLNVTTVGHGAVAKNPDQPSYTHGTVVTLTATPTPGYSFVGWSGDATGSTNPLAVTMTSNLNITASFTLDLNVTVVGSGAVAKSPNQANYAPGTVVALTANPAVGWHFVNWTGDTTGTASPLSVTVNTDKNITANFAINTYTLDVIATGNGSVAKSPDQATYPHGTVVRLTPTPLTGHAFVDWTGDASGTTNPLDVTMDRNKTITGRFTYALTVTPTAGGTVAKSPNQPNYAPGTVVTLTATPDVGYTFTGWTGDATGSTNPLAVTMNANRNIGATFTINSYPLNVSIVGSGSVIKSPNQPTYPHGTVVTLTAVPAAGWHLLNWSGDATGSTNPVDVTMTSTKNVTATFEINTYPLTVTVVGSGSVAKSPDQPLYSHGTIVNLTANPGTGWHFVSWSGDASGTTSPVAVTMNSAKSVTATFAINTYTLSVTSIGNGSVTKNPDQPTYPHGATVDLTATALTGHSFLGWSGDASGSANPLTVTMNQNRSITATFSLALNVTTSGSGSVSKSPNQPNYAPGSSVTLTATPAVGWRFVSWSGDTSGSTNPLLVKMGTTNKNIGATFAINTYPLTVTISGSGTVAKSPDQPLYDHGTVVQLTATPATGWSFTGWSGDATGSTNPVSVTMTSAKNVTATFTINTYPLTVTVSGSGAVTKNPNQALYNHGTVVQLTATPAPGWCFAGWSGDATGSTNPVNVTMTSAKNVTVTFIICTYPLNVTISGNGSVSKSPNQPLYDHGTVVTLTAVPDSGNHLASWGGDASGSGNPITITMDRAKSVSATFAVNTYELLVQVNGAGTVSRSPDLPAYPHGSVVNLTPVPDPGYDFTGWSGDASGSTVPLPVTMDGEKTIVATFVIRSYALAVSVAGTGSVSKNPDQPTYTHGTNVTLTATPATGWSFTGWSGDLSGSTSPAIVTMNAPKSITASFTINVYPLTVTASGPGSVSRNPDQPGGYAYGSVVAVTATPQAGVTFVGWSGDASGTTNPLSVTVNAAKTIVASFADVTPPTVQALDPNGNEVLAVGTNVGIHWAASDGRGVSAVDLLLSRSGAAGPFDTLATGLANTGTHTWTVTGPNTTNAWLRVVARDGAGNAGSDVSDSAFTIVGSPLAAGDDVPIDFALAIVGPNPTRGRTLVEYTLPREASVRLTLHDVQGRELAVLEDGIRPSGRHRVTWNGMPDRGSAPAGVYFVRLRAGGHTFVRRLILAR